MFRCDAGVRIAGVSPQNKVLQIQPRREGIVARTLGGFIAGCLMAAAGFFACKRFAPPGPNLEFNISPH